ncbi:MAG: hypothetical protein K0S53_2848 [Bacteroidetes bacterium]|jgi:hypothetical protein|nr:hypothetical protein [Bacteroidota bacterium]MDF2453510.1 hypothetical protein [Bacteroidota bacterium]
MNKTIFTLITVTFFSLHIFANGPGKHPEKYCAKMQDGLKVVMHEGKPITSEVTLKNGTTIKPDGTITKPDGSKMELQADECISLDGNVAMEKEKKKYK